MQGVHHEEPSADCIIRLIRANRQPFDGKSNSFGGSGERDGVMVMMVEYGTRARGSGFDAYLHRVVCLRKNTYVPTVPINK